MPVFEYRDSHLHAERAPLAELAERFGTPCYVYSRAEIEGAWRAFDRAFEDRAHLICYAVKANSNLAVLKLLADLGSGFDIVSVGELERVLVAGGDPRKIVFAGVGKRADEMRRALEVGVRCFHVESEPELERLNRVAGDMAVRAPVALRVNPDVDAKTHPYISTGLKDNKFGIAMGDALALYRRAAAMDYIEICGVGCHIGSQLTRIEPILDATDRLLGLVHALAGEGIRTRHLDVGGGLGIAYHDEQPPRPEEYVRAICERTHSLSCEIIVEPGRAIVGNGGVLLTRIEYLKSQGERRFAIVDAAMNDLLRPALYNAWQEISPVWLREGEAETYDVVGPVCESADCLGAGRRLSVLPGDLLAIRSAGAYGFSMSSSYNSRPRAAEVMVDGARAHLIRRRETIAESMAGESTLPDRGAA